jgi:hypothetical protein
MSTTGNQQEATGRRSTAQVPQVSAEQLTDIQVDGATPARGAGWRAFSGIMLLVLGFFNMIDALVGITNASYYQHVANSNGIVLPATNNIHTWGWVELGFSIVLLIAGCSVLAMGRALISRTIGVIVAGVNMLFQLAYLAHFPFWSFTMIIVDILVIYGLVRRVEEVEA